MRHMLIRALCAFFCLLPGRAAAQEFPYTTTVPAPAFDQGAWFSPYSLNAPAHLSALTGFHAIFSVSENLSDPLQPWHVSSETLWLSHSLPLVKAACFISGSALHDVDGYSGGILGAGCGWSVSPSWSLGLRLLAREAPSDPSTDGGRDWALSALFAPGGGFTASYQVESLLMRPVAGLPQDRVHRLELALGSRWRFWTGFHLAERRLDWALTGGLRMELYRGVQLVLSGGWAQRTREAWRDGAPLELSQPESFTVAANVVVQLENLALFQGFSLPEPTLNIALRWSSRIPGRSVLPDPDFLQLYDLSDKADETRHARFALAIRHCLRTRACRGVLVKLGDADPSWSHVDEWSDWIDLLKSSDRKVFVYGATFSNASYALAAGADGIYLFPGGSVKLRGLSTQQFFLAQAMQNLGIGADLVQIGTYKSAPEMFMRRSPSTPAFTQSGRLLLALDMRFKALVLKRQNLSLDRFHDITRKMELTGEQALAAGLVDGLWYADQVAPVVFRKAGQVLGLADASRYTEPDRGGRGVAWLLFSGEIVSQKSTLPNPLTGGDTIELKKAAAALAAVTGNPRFGAVVLRINSPGGSASASEALWRMVLQVSTRLPVVISIGDMAASGGYYMAVGGRVVFATESSLVGSIGVFGGKFQVKDLLSRLGVGITTHKRAPLADADSVLRPYTDEERELVRGQLESTYRRFVTAVAAGRKFSAAAALRRADGRVMLGRQAQREGLVDDIGGLLAANARAAQLAGLSADAPVFIVYPAPEPFWKRALKAAVADAGVTGLDHLRALAGTLSLEGPWALWTDMVSIH
ncbi:S49 family peptidase [Myxococcota bacterium]|nr:S49 family peptidase [Myxococcota bacterium]